MAGDEKETEKLKAVKGTVWFSTKYISTNKKSKECIQYVSTEGTSHHT